MTNTRKKIQRFNSAVANANWIAAQQIIERNPFRAMHLEAMLQNILTKGPDADRVGNAIVDKALGDFNDRSGLLEIANREGMTLTVRALESCAVSSAPNPG